MQTVGLGPPSCEMRTFCKLHSIDILRPEYFGNPSDGLPGWLGCGFVSQAVIARVFVSPANWNTACLYHVLRFVVKLSLHWHVYTRYLPPAFPTPSSIRIIDVGPPMQDDVEL